MNGKQYNARKGIPFTLYNYTASKLEMKSMQALTSPATFSSKQAVENGRLQILVNL